MKLRQASHTVYKTQYHIVYAGEIPAEGSAKGGQWHRSTSEQLRKCSPDIEFIEVGIDRDHGPGLPFGASYSEIPG